MCWACLMMTPRRVRDSLGIWEVITWWRLCSSASTKPCLGHPAARSMSPNSLTTGTVRHTAACCSTAHAEINVDILCHCGCLPVTLLLGLTQRCIKHTLPLILSWTEAFLLKLAAPLKLRVGRSIYFARGFHILLAFFCLTSVAPSPPCLVVHLVLFVSLLDLSVNLLFHWVIIWTSSCSPPPRPKATAGVSKICSLSVGKCFQQKLMWLRMFIPNRGCHWQLQTKAYWMQ